MVRWRYRLNLRESIRTALVVEKRLTQNFPTLTASQNCRISKVTLNKKKKGAPSTCLFKMRVVAEVPSREMEETRERRVMGMSSSKEKRVAFHELTQSMLSSLYLDDKQSSQPKKKELFFFVYKEQFLCI